ncbi:MAG: hypothetical protein NTY02_12615, partial [Acidobacteria bacterium]|nr:hypothetical protein [Acidobacteriota bacterium]
PIGWRVFGGIPAVYDALASRPRGVTVEFPIYDRRSIYANATYMLNSTRHWQPLINGYSGFVPVSYLQAWSELQSFPQFEALEALHARGVKYIIIHRDAFAGRHGQAAFDAITGIASLAEIAHEGDIHIYRFE